MRATGTRFDQNSARAVIRVVRSSKGTADPTPHSRELGMDPLPRRVGAEPPLAGRGYAGGQGRTAQPERSAIERHAAMTWARRLERVFGIDVESCVRCAKAVRVIASIEEPALIERILAHAREKGRRSTASLGPPSTGAPVSA